MSATIQDISDATGVHRNTVGKILKDSYKGDEITIQSVKNMAKKLGYGAEQSKDDDALPEGVRIYEPEVRLTRNHKFTMEFSVKVACEWEYEQDKEGKLIHDSKTPVDYEDVSFSLCFPEYPTKREIELAIAQARSTLPDAV